MTEMMVECTPEVNGHNHRKELSDRPVDLVHLARYTLGNRALEKEVLELYRCQSGVNLKRLKSATSDQEWCDTVHSIKGSSRGIGAWQVADFAEFIEQQSDDFDSISQQQNIATLERYIEATNHFIQVLLEDD